MCGREGFLLPDQQGREYRSVAVSENLVLPMSDVKERWKSRPNSVSMGCEQNLPHS